MERPTTRRIFLGALNAAALITVRAKAGTRQRSMEHYQKAVELIQAGKLGQISEVRVWDYENYCPGAGHQVAWGVHHLDVVLWAMQVSSPKAVFATGGNFAYFDNHEYPDTFTGTLEFGPGPVSKHGFLLHYEMRTGGRPLPALGRRQPQIPQRCRRPKAGPAPLPRALETRTLTQSGAPRPGAVRIN